MSDAQKEKILFAIVEETVPGTPEAITANDFLALTEEGAAFNSPRDKVDTNELSGDRLKKSSVKTIQNGDGSVTIYLKAGENAGDEPESDLLLRSQGWSKEKVVSKTATTTGNTASVLQVASGAEASYKVGQYVLVNNVHTSPIKSLAAGEIELLIPASAAFSDGVEIEKLCAYRLDDGSDVSFTGYKLFNKLIQQSIPYSKTQNISLNDLSVASVPKMNATFMGIDFLEEDLGTPLAVNPDFLATEKPFMLEACLYRNGVKIEASEVSIAFEQTIARKRTLCAPNGNKSTRGTGKYNISGSFVVYKKDDEAGDLPGDSKFSLSLAMYVPSSVEGEKVNLVCVHIPNCKIDEIDSNSDIEGLITSNITFMAEPDSDSSTYPVITFI